MARTRTGTMTSADSVPPDSETNTVRWTLAELPTSQHRAGLAGLAMMVSYTKRHALPHEAKLEVEYDDARLSLTVNRAGLEALFDRVYAASIQETESEKPRKRKLPDGSKVDVPPKRRETRTVNDAKGRPRTTEIYIYDVVVPHGGVLNDWSPPGDSGLWIKLWREWLWSSLRAIPRQRLPYQRRAAEVAAAGINGDEDADDEAKENGDIEDAWSALHNDPSVKQASTYFLGAMDANAELVPFRDRGRFQFLLHFWPFAVHIFVPVTINAKGERTMDGYVACIPDVSRLREFVARYERTLKQRSPDAAGFRPRQALIDLAEAAALESERWQERAVGERLGPVQPATAGWQVIHTVKEGNNVRIRTNRIIIPSRSSLDCSAVAADCRSHLVRHQVLSNALSERPWWHGFDRVCATHAKEHTIKEATFRQDARLLFDRASPAPSQKDSDMSDTAPNAPRPPRPLELIILHAVQSWLTGRLRSKYQLEYQPGADNPEYREKKAKLATEAFLAARSRPGREFARWFTATLCSENQRLSEEEFVTLAKALDEHPDRVRSLTLLALSARG